MAVSFNQIPASLRVPGMRVEVNSGERPYQGQSRILFIAPKLAAGKAPAGVPIRLPSNPIEAFGTGSIAAEVALLARRQSAVYEMWFLPVADPSGTAGAQTVTVNSVPAAGAYPLWVHGRRRSITVAGADTTATLAGKIAAAIQSPYYLSGLPTAITPPVTAAAATNVVTITDRHKGVITGTDSRVDFALYDETSALAAAVTVGAVTAGTGAPDLALALAALGDTEIDWYGCVFDDSASIDALSDFVTARWDPMSMQYGLAVFARQDAYGALAAAGGAMNDRARILIGQYDSPDSKWAILAQCTAGLAEYYDLGATLTEAQRLARPCNGRILRDLNPPRSGGNAFDTSERNALYYDGVSPLTCTADGKVTFERVITTYQHDDQGMDDINYLDINYPLIDIYTVRYTANYVWGVHANTSAAGDTEPYHPAQSRPKDVRASFGHALSKLRNEAHILEDIDGMLKRLVVERSSDPTRINAEMSIDRVNPLHVLAVNVQASAQFQS
ncbi:tail sheath protein [Camelimonas fluminis]|uniref:Phage tail sheath gpL-like n=1 Tax=Camelimonas fluminis TaxID=1576911 RepID=A0ABV7UEA1_9HYPH|nr:hypothetical protein [Camelimonas fluminis]GHE50978.1 tail sheath protein [Camelimonas fluminis]